MVQAGCDSGSLAPDAGSIRGLFHRHDAARLEADRSDYAVPLRWSVRLEPGDAAHLVVATESGHYVELQGTAEQEPFDRAALEIAQGGDRESCLAVLRALIEGLRV